VLRKPSGGAAQKAHDEVGVAFLQFVAHAGQFRHVHPHTDAGRLLAQPGDQRRHEHKSN
jgi:hypothetical protein